jgi:hypothetical protein
MQQFLLLLKSKAPLEYTPEELESRLAEYRQWVETIPNHYITDNRLEKTGTYISEGKPVLTDGPFLELSEIIAGFVIIQAAGLEEATRVAQTAPLVRYFDIMVRPMVGNQTR